FDAWRTTLVAPVAAAALPALGGEGPAAAPPAYHRLSPTHIAVDVDAPRAGLLNLSEVWYPGWTATVDGQPAPLLRAYTTLMAVPVAAGAHRVELRFDPPLVRLGLAISGITLLLVAIGLVWTRTRRRA
ncbi:MAG: YfhO family protein, partial [Anaerolineae bacterium]|nr:YfhO family protein [Anaerolineae bacterium]